MSGAHRSSVPSPFELATKLQALQQDPDDAEADSAAAADDNASSDNNDHSFQQWGSQDSVESAPASTGGRRSNARSGASMNRAMSMGSQPKNPYCLWAVESTPFTTPASSVLGFPSDSGVSLAMKLKDADVDVFADPTEMRLSKAFSDALNNAAMKPGFLRAATAAGVVQPVLEEMLLRVSFAPAVCTRGVTLCVGVSRCLRRS